MSFASTAWLWALLALPVLALVEAWWRGPTGASARSGGAPAVGARSCAVHAAAGATRGWRCCCRRRGPGAGSGARPQWGIVREKVEREGVDVVLALDSSGSMATEDVPPSRFFIAKSALAYAGRASWRVTASALLAFEGEAYPLVPLTLDADAVGLFLETLEPWRSSPRAGRRSASGCARRSGCSWTRSGATR